MPTRIEKLKDDLAHAREKAAEWNARAREIERKINEQENLEILQLVHSVAASPEELRGLLARITAANKPPIKQEVQEHHEKKND